MALLEPLAKRVHWLAISESNITSNGFIHVAKLQNLNGKETLLYDSADEAEDDNATMTTKTKSRTL